MWTKIHESQIEIKISPCMWNNNESWFQMHTQGGLEFKQRRCWNQPEHVLKNRSD